MTIKQFIEKAIEGGCDIGVETLSERIHELYCEQYEKDNGVPYWTGGDYSKLREETKEYDRNIARFMLGGSLVFLDPEAWKAVGKVEGWGEEPYNHSSNSKVFGTYRPRWEYEMHRMIDALADGKTIAEYLATL